ncbi:MAG: hypothetical protein P8099_17560 [Gemmatimonadota bacterium]|jgi:hypothetical protein
MEQVERSKPRRSLGWLWMILSLILIAAFMTWLGLESKPTEVTVQTNEEGAPEGAAAPVVPLDSFSLHPDQYVGQEIQLQNVQAQSSMGPQAYWLDMPTNVPFLLKADSSLAASGDFAMESGTRYNVLGRVIAMSDSVLNAWQQSGAIGSEGERMQAEFATAFIEASQVQRTGGASGTGGPSSGAGGTGQSSGPGQGQ